MKITTTKATTTKASKATTKAKGTTSNPYRVRKSCEIGGETWSQSALIRAVAGLYHDTLTNPEIQQICEELLGEEISPTTIRCQVSAVRETFRVYESGETFHQTAANCKTSYDEATQKWTSRHGKVWGFNDTQKAIVAKVAKRLKLVD